MTLKIRVSFSLFLYLFLTNFATPLLTGQTADSLSIDNSFPSDSLFFSKDSISINDSLLTADSLMISDSLSKKTIADTLHPIYRSSILGENEFGTTLNDLQISKLDFRYTGNIISYLPAGYLFDLAHAGQPGEASLYGTGFNNISFLADGVLINNRFQNSFDLNNIQSENIDSLELVSLPKGFMYSSFNNPVTINFNTTDKIVNVPTTKIRFFQGPDDEGYFGAAFNAYLMNRLAGSVSVSTYGVNDRFVNSESVNWNVSTKMRYMLSNKINIVGSYHYVESTVNLFGGVDYDSMRVLYDETTFESELFDAPRAVVEYGLNGSQSLRYQKVTDHNISLKFLSEFDNLKNDLTFYYHFNKNEYRQNEKGTAPTLQKIINDNKDKTIGANLDSKFHYSIFNINLLSNFETIEYKSPLLNNHERRNYISVGGIVETKFLGGLIKPSAFGKYLNYDENNFTSFGADLTINISDNFIFYGGYSYVEKPLNILEETTINSTDHEYNLLLPDVSKYKLNIVEAGVKFNTKVLFGKISFYTNKTKGLEPILLAEENTKKQNRAEYYRKREFNIKGLAASVNFQISKLLLTVNGNWNIDPDNEIYVIPEFVFNGGLYYVNTLFEDNLNLKTGFNAAMYGKRNAFLYDFERSSKVVYQYSSSKNEFSLINPAQLGTDFQLDFYLAGTIQEAATLYFIWENLMGRDYFQVPYYPQRARAIRLGVLWTLFD